LNRTKVELKYFKGITAGEAAKRLNRTKVELKCSGKRLFYVGSAMFESHQSGIEI